MKLRRNTFYRLTILSPTFSPKQLYGAPDERKLGLAVAAIRLGGRPYERLDDEETAVVPLRTRQSTRLSSPVALRFPDLKLILCGHKGRHESQRPSSRDSALSIRVCCKAAICCTIGGFPGSRVRTKSFVFAPPSHRKRHLSIWVFACFRSSCRLVFDMTPITEFDPVSQRI